MTVSQTAQQAICTPGLTSVVSSKSSSGITLISVNKPYFVSNLIAGYLHICKIERKTEMKLYFNFFYKLVSRTKNGMFLLIYLHLKFTSEKENSLLIFYQKGVGL